MDHNCECGGHCYRCPECNKPECECHCYDYLDEDIPFNPNDPPEEE